MDSETLTFQRIAYARASDGTITVTSRSGRLLGEIALLDPQDSESSGLPAYTVMFFLALRSGFTPLALREIAALVERAKDA